MYMFMCARMYLQWGEANNKSSPISPEMEWHKPPCHFLHFSHHVVRHKTTLYFTQTVMLMLCDPKKETVTPLVKAEGTNSSLSLIHFYEYFHHCIYIITSIVYYIINIRAVRTPVIFQLAPCETRPSTTSSAQQQVNPTSRMGGGEHPAISWLYDGICYKCTCICICIYVNVYVYMYMCAYVWLCMYIYPLMYRINSHRNQFFKLYMYASVCDSILKWQVWEYMHIVFVYITTHPTTIALPGKCFSWPTIRGPQASEAIPICLKQCLQANHQPIRLQLIER